MIILFLTMITCSIPEITHKNQGVSTSVGSTRNGKLENGWLMPYKGNNFYYFSLFSYYILNNAYVHSAVHATLLEAYRTCETSCPGKTFVYMECTRKKGGKMIFHWTHENGTSVDFMVPKLNDGNSNVWSNKAGLSHYLFGFDADGRFSLNRNTRIDFETMARHLNALDDAATKNGLRIRKILFNTDLHDDLFKSEAGQKLTERQLNIIPRLNNLVNRFHDDHYHVDFELATR